MKLYSLAILAACFDTSMATIFCRGVVPGGDRNICSNTSPAWDSCIKSCANNCETGSLVRGCIYHDEVRIDGDFDCWCTYWGMLAQFHKDRDNKLFRLPCANCQLLLLALDILTGKTDYDTELYSKFPNFDGEQKKKNKNDNSS
ncbi:hypothetical protein FALBO_11210 [Fusarium albosuccineum]|uniref:Uncharacterized protein n=1 Tax=Fusarium albosuccineum TaxID=1237068 RepID=A0A8H4L5G5_9HYPO|nr:hypothetical protein FALBO_11210 [Fusarium albosuccineum]